MTVSVLSGDLQWDRNEPDAAPDGYWPAAHMCRLAPSPQVNCAPVVRQEEEWAFVTPAEAPPYALLYLSVCVQEQHTQGSAIVIDDLPEAPSAHNLP